MKRKFEQLEENIKPSSKKMRIEKETVIDVLINHLDLKLSSSWLLIGMTGSGKSYLSNKFITQYISDETYYFSPTPEHIEFTVTKHYDNDELQIDIIRDLLSRQKTFFNIELAPTIKIIINDYAYCLKDKEVKKTLEHLVTSGRHYKVHLIILTQFYTSIPATIRANIQNNIYFGTTNKNELTNIKRLGFQTPVKDIAYFISKLEKFEYILQIPSKITGKPIYTKCKCLDIIEKISEY